MFIVRGVPERAEVYLDKAYLIQKHFAISHTP